MAWTEVSAEDGNDEEQVGFAGDEMEVVFEDETTSGQPLDEDKVQLSKQEYEALKQQRGGDATEVIKQLAEVLKQQQPVNQPMQERGETDEEYEARLEAELFKPGQSGKALRSFMERELGKREAMYAQSIANLSKQIAKSDPANALIFEKYSDEVEATLQRLTPQQRADPNAMAWALGEVKKNHFNDILEMEIERRTKGKEEAAGKDKKQAPASRGSAVNASPSGVSRQPIKVKESDYRAALQQGEQMFGPGRLAEQYAKKIIAGRR